MHHVGNHLRVQAMTASDAAQREAFARSAYNRYYYGVYFNIRCLFRILEKSFGKSWADSKHASYSDILNKITNFLEKEKDKADNIPDTNLVNKIKIAIASCDELVQILNLARTSRVIADYSPKIRVKFLNSEGFSIKEVTDNQAFEWNEKAISCCEIIFEAWRDTNEL